MAIEWVDLVGAVGATASVASFTPQAVKIIRERCTEGLSVGMYLLTCLAFASWLTFGVIQGEWALIIPNAICLLLAAFILVLILLPERQVAKVADSLDPDG